MKVLLDENITHGLRFYLTSHEVFTVAYMKWNGLKNGRLLAKAAEGKFDALLTLDDGIAYQTNLLTLPLSVIAIRSPSATIDDLKPLVVPVLRALDRVNRNSPGVIRVPSSPDE